MPSRFSVSGPQEIQANLLTPAQYLPHLYIGGDPINGFEPSPIPPRMSYWGVAFRDKQINAALTESGNVTTWVLNNVVDPLIPGEQRYVSLGAGLLMREQSGTKKPVMNGFEALARHANPAVGLATMNVADIDARLQFEDQDFDPNSTTDNWLKDERNALLKQLAAREGFDIETMLRDTRNLNHFVYTQNRVLAHAQAMQRIRKWEDQAGTALKWTSRIHSGIQNFLLTDPSFGPSLVIPAGALRTAGTAVKVGSKVTRLAAPVIGGQRALALGRSVAALTPEAVHAGMSYNVGHRAAVAVELGAYGGVWDLAFQQQRIQESEIMFDDPELQQHFSWAELGLAVGIGATLGYVVGGRAGVHKEQMRKATVESVGGSPANPIYHSFNNIRAEGRVNGAVIRAQRAAMAVLENDFDMAANWLDPGMLQQAGLSQFHIADLLEQIATAAGGRRLNKNAVTRVVSDFISDAADTRATRETLEQTFSGQIEQAALAEALGRASRELPQTATNHEVLIRAQELVPEEIQRIEDHMQSKAAQARPANATEAEFWRGEATELSEIAKRRTLTDAEMDYLGTVRGKLRSIGESDPFDGLAVNAARRYTDGSIFDPFRARLGHEVSRTIQQMFNERQLIRELEADKLLGKKVGRGLKNAKARLRRAEARLEKQMQDFPTEAAAPTVPSEAQQSIARLREKWAANPPTTEAQLESALDELVGAMDFNHNALIEDGTMLGKLLHGWGLGRFARAIGTSGTGMNQTIRSTLGALRELAHEFDAAKLRVGDLDPNRTTVHRTIQDLIADLESRTSEMVDEYQRLHQAGKFGSSIRFLRYMRRRRDFDREIVLHITGTQASSDKDVIKLANIWLKHAEEIGQVGEDAGILKRRIKGRRFFPRRWLVGTILKNEQEFVNDLGRHFRQSWLDSDDVHLDTLVQMGKARRVVTQMGDEVDRWEIAGRKDTISELKRSELAGLGIDEQDYLRAIDEVGDDGFTPMTRSANRSKSRLLGDDAYEKDATGRTRRRRHGAPHSAADRAIEETVWANPAMHKYLDFRFLHGAHSYMRTTGMRVLNRARHQTRWGIPNLDMDTTLNWLSKRLEAMNAKHSDVEAWRIGVDTLREKLQLAEGRLPTIRDHTNKFIEFLSATGQAVAGTLYGSGIGQAVLSTEVAQSIMSRLGARPDDIALRGAAIFKGFSRRSAEARANMQALGLTTRQYQLHTLERLTGGALHSEGFQFGIVPKLLAPWLDVFDAIAGRTVAHGGAGLGRLGTVPAGFRAAAGNMMTIGGMDYFTQFARMVHVQSMLDETGRFFRAAEKTAKALKDAADDLDAVESKARAAALAKSPDNLEAARAAGGRARMKAWVGIARKNGFGANWQVAERMARHKLLDPEKLAMIRKAGEATGALRDSGTFRTLDWNELMKYQATNAQELAQLAEARTSLRNMMVETLHKRVSEQSIMQTPTSVQSRSALGRLHMSMTSFARSWYDNNILDTAQMPARTGVALLTMYLLGETMNRTMRDLWRGREIEDIIRDIEDDPDNYVARTLTNVPLLGQYSMMARPFMDAITLNDRRMKVDTGESAAEGAFSATTDMVFDSIHGISPLAEDQEVQSRTWRTAARFIPGYRSWWAMLLSEGVLEPAGIDIPGTIEGGGRYRRYGASKVRIPELPEPQEGEVQLGPKFPEDISFTYE